MRVRNCQLLINPGNGPRAECGRERERERERGEREGEGERERQREFV